MSDIFDGRPMTPGECVEHKAFIDAQFKPVDSPTPMGTGLGDDTLVEYDAPFNPPTVQLALYSQAQLDAYVSAAVQEANSRYDWLAENCHRVIKSGDHYSYVPGSGAPFRDYPSVDALVSSEMRKEATP